MVTKEFDQQSFGPVLKRQDGTTYAPYQEQREALGETHYDVTIVFGEGPPKDVRFLSELNEDERKAYEMFTASPKTQPEPGYIVIDDAPHGPDSQSGLDKNPYYSMMEEIRSNPNLTEEEKQLRVEARRLEWQRMGQYGMRRWGEFNALATGLAMYLNLSDKFILTGGRTMSKEQEATLRTRFSEEHPGESFDSSTYKDFIKANVASEAELMRDLILRRFGRLMFYREHSRDQLEAAFNVARPMEKLNLEFAEQHSQDELHTDYERRVEAKMKRLAEQPDRYVPDEFPLDTFGDYLEGRRGSYRYKQYRKFENDKYQQYVQEQLLPRLILEDEATTTPENIVYSVNKNPELFAQGSSVAVITNDHHVPRATEFVHLFGGVTSEIGQISAQRLLKHRAEIRSNELYGELMHYFYADTDSNVDLAKKQQTDIQKTEYLKMPERIMYWIGHIGMLDNDERVQTLLDETKARDGDHRWVEALSLAFQEVGLLYSDREEDREKSDNFYYHSIPEVHQKDPALYARFKEAMSKATGPFNPLRDIVFVTKDGHLQKTDT